VQTVYLLVICHLIGDYVLQSDFLASTKGANWYHLFVHSLLYTVPFFLYFGADWRLLYIACTHFLIDAFKARWHWIGYPEDQMLHYCELIVYLF